MAGNCILSIICATYNHEKYIEKAIRGIYAQVTSYKYEVLVGEDCSTDNSRVVLKRLEKEFPEMQVFYREKNYGANQNFKDLTARAKGKYVIILETDDFWISPFKLQKQIDFLEAHPDYIAVAHKCLMVGKDNELLNIKYPEIDHEEYTLDDFYKGKFAGQTATLMYRNFYTLDCGYDCSIATDSKYEYGPGDRKKNFMFVSVGRVACIQEIMSAYRLVENSGSSYSAQLKNNKLDYIKFRKIFVEYSHESNINEKSIYIAELIYTEVLFKYLLKRNRKINLRFVSKEINQLRFKNKCCFFALVYCFYALFRRVTGDTNVYRNLTIKERKEAISIYKSSIV